MEGDKSEQGLLDEWKCIGSITIFSGEVLADYDLWCLYLTLVSFSRVVVDTWVCLTWASIDNDFLRWDVSLLGVAVESVDKGTGVYVCFLLASGCLF